MRVKREDDKGTYWKQRKEQRRAGAARSHRQEEQGEAARWLQREGPEEEEEEVRWLQPGEEGEGGGR